MKQVEGILVVIEPTVEFATKAGSIFKKRLAVVRIDHTTEYPQDIAVEFTQDKCGKLDKFQVGQHVVIDINLRGSKHEKDGKTSYFVSLSAWKIAAAAPGPYMQPNTGIPGQHNPYGPQPAYQPQQPQYGAYQPQQPAYQQPYQPQAPAYQQQPQYATQPQQMNPAPAVVQGDPSIPHQHPIPGVNYVRDGGGNYMRSLDGSLIVANADDLPF